MSSTPQTFASPFTLAAASAADERRVMIGGAVAAAAAAVLYAASPVTFWATLVLIALMLWAVRDLPPAERRWFLWASGIAVALRFAVTGLLPLIALRSGRSFVAWFGDGYYNVERSIWLRNIFVGVPIAAFDYFEAFQPVFGRTSYQFLLAYVHLLFGPSPFGAHLVSTVLYGIAVVLLYRLARRAYGPVPAMLTALSLWYFPSLFAWSVSAMKESEMVCVSAVALAATVGVIRAQTPSRRAVFALVLALAMVTLQGLRAGALEIVAGGLVLGVLLRIATLRSWLLVATIVVVPLALWSAVRPSLITRLDDQIKIAARHHIGNVWTPGESYRVLDERFYNYDDVQEIRLVQPNAIDAMTHAEMARYLIRSAGSFFVVPELWHPLGKRVRWLIPEQVVWYAALLLAVPGLIAGWRQDALVTSLLAGSILAGMAIIAPNSGNIATLIRHRDMVSPFVFMLAAVGAASLLRAAAHRGLT